MAPSSLPFLLTLFPKKMKAIMTPTTIHRTVSHIRLIPYCAAIPPNPTIAEVLMKVAP